MLEEQERRQSGLERDLQVGYRCRCCCCNHVTVAACAFPACICLRFNRLLRVPYPTLAAALPSYLQLAIANGEESTQRKVDALEQLEKATEVGACYRMCRRRGRGGDGGWSGLLPS